MLSSRERIKGIIRGEPVDRCGFWLGKPLPDTVKKINAAIGTDSLESIQQRFHDDIRWVTPQYMTTTYQHPDGLSMRPWKEANPHGLTADALLADADCVEDLDEVAFPESKYLDFSETIEVLESMGDVYRLSGFWSAFFHDLTYLFGTEEMLILMLTEPDVITEALERICGFYLEANEKFFSEAKGLVDALFIGNDFGTQNGLLFSPEHFRKFFLPWIEKFAAQAHRHGIDFILHSCGGIADIIPDLIAVGVDCLHPFQVNANGMDIPGIAAQFKGEVVFMGGVDTQDLLVNGSADEVCKVAAQLVGTFGNTFILGPSHEALLDNVNVDNLVQLAECPRY